MTISDASVDVRGDSMTGSHESIVAGDVFAALSESDRRTALRTLRCRPSGVDLDALAETVADRATDERAADVRARLHHAHLPMLDELGLIEYDASEQTAHCDWDDDVDESFTDARRILEQLQQRNG